MYSAFSVIIQQRANMSRKHFLSINYDNADMMLALTMLDSLPPTKHEASNNGWKAPLYFPIGISFFLKNFDILGGNPK